LARKKQARRVKDKWKSKQWYRILAPEFFGSGEIGNTLADDPEKVIGRTVETTLASLINDYSNQNDYKKLTFRIFNTSGETAYTKLTKYEMTRDYLTSLTRRRTSMIDDVVDLTTKDGYRIRVKPVCFTIKRCQTSQRREIRRVMRDIILNRGQELEFVQFVQEIVLGKISSDIYKAAKNIYPLRRVEIKKLEVLSEPMPAVTAEKAEATA
jgi:small subunit ribosomal protein S3Ae